MAKTIILGATVAAIALLSGILAFTLPTAAQADTIQLQPQTQIAVPFGDDDDDQTVLECQAACLAEHQPPFDACIDVAEDQAECLEEDAEDQTECLAEVSADSQECRTEVRADFDACNDECAEVDDDDD